jgi:hypothetical protein
VNFMSNPDERTAIDQFGTGDKFFGVATMLATLPGLPMFAHGQVEGYTERYGMEYKQAKMDEWPNEGLIARHMHEIAPLLKRRRIFAESANFVLYAFWTGYGTVDENVFAYSNRNGSERSIVLYNNSYGSTHGTIHISAASMDKGTGELRQRSLAEGLDVGWDESLIFRYRDQAKGLEYLRRATDIHRYGLTLDLRGYQYAVLLDWNPLHSTAAQPWDQLCDSLGGAGVHSVDHALSLLRLRPLHEALEHALHPGALRVLAEMGRELLKESQQKAPAGSESQKEAKPAGKESAEKESVEQRAVAAPVQLSAREQMRLGDWLQSVDGFAWRAAEILQPQSAEEFVREFREQVVPMVAAALRLPLLERSFSTVWPGTVRTLLPNCEPGASAERTWTPVLAWAILSSLPVERPEEMFDQLQLREALGAIFSTSGLEGEDVWRAAARVRVLLAFDQPLQTLAYSRRFWNDPDVRWLTGVNESGGKTYFNKEATDELLAWMALPSLLKTVESVEPQGELRRLEGELGDVSAGSKAAGFELERLLGRSSAEVVDEEMGGPDAAALAEELPADDAVPAKAVTPAESSPGRRK